MIYQPDKYLRVYYEGVGNINYEVPGGGGPPFVAAASNGVFYDTADNNFKWGTNGAIGTPFTADRFIDMAFHSMNYVQPKFIYDNPAPDTHEYHLGAQGVNIEQIFSASTTNLVPFERQVNFSANGGPPDDNVYIQGWNIDSDFDGTSPSWTWRLEYKFVGDFYENHLQFSNPTAGTSYRLLSFTLQDHGNPLTDLCLAFFQGTGVEMRNLVNGNTHWACANSTSAGVDNTIVTVASNANNVSTRFIVDGAALAVTMENHAAIVPFTWDLFGSYKWILGNDGGVNFAFFDDLGGQHYSNFVVRNNITTAGALNQIVNDQAHFFSMYMAGSAAGSAGIQVADSGNLTCNGISGLNIINTNAITPQINFGMGAASVGVMNISASGALCLGNGTTPAVASALYEMDSTTKGMLLMRMTTTQKNAIAAPAEGLLVYDITLHKLSIRTAAAWETVTSV